MRILLTTPTFPPFNSGLGNAVAQQARYLATAGNEVTVATGGADRASFAYESISVETFKIQGSGNILSRIRGDSGSYKEFLVQTQWDAVVLNAWQNWATDIALKHLDTISGVKILYSHCISTNMFFSQQPIKSLLRYLTWRPYWWRLSQRMHSLDGVIFLASGGSDSRFDDFELAKKKAVPFFIVPNSLSSDAAISTQEPVRPFAERDILIVVGAYQWQKGFDFVLRAYAASNAREKYEIHFYGQEHSEFSEHLIKLIQELDLPRSKVIFHEGVSGAALQAAKRSAKLVLSGSHTECQPLVLIDASAAGTPFIARRTGCIAAMPGGVAVASVSDMTTQIDRILESRDVWKDLSDAGRAAARDYYDPKVTGEALVDVLEKLTKVNGS